MTPDGFEKIIQKVFEHMGHEVQSTKSSGDNGIDAVVFINKHKFIVQCKKYATSNKVGEPALRDLLGTVTKEKAKGGFFVTTSDFTNAAIQWAKNTSLTLIDSSELVELMKKVYSDTSASGTPTGQPIKCKSCGNNTAPTYQYDRRDCSCSGYSLYDYFEYKDTPKEGDWWVGYEED